MCFGVQKSCGSHFDNGAGPLMRSVRQELARRSVSNWRRANESVWSGQRILWEKASEIVDRRILPEVAASDRAYKVRLMKLNPRDDVDWDSWKEGEPIVDHVLGVAKLVREMLSQSDEVFFEVRRKKRWFSKDELHFRVGFKPLDERRAAALQMGREAISLGRRASF